MGTDGAKPDKDTAPKRFRLPNTTWASVTTRDRVRPAHPTDVGDDAADEPTPEPQWELDTSWRPDLLDGFERRDLPLPAAAPALGEPEGPLHAVLVRPVEQSTSERAVLYVHGWNDYFFQAHLADFWTARGYAFHAVDLRRYGRAHHDGQLLGFITDLDEYLADLDAAVDVIRAEHSSVTVMGHSTGGLIAALWADQRPGELDGLILNSPWLDLQGAPVVRTLGAPLVETFGAQRPTTVIPLPDSGNYKRALHADEGGEWTYDLSLKSSPSAPIRVGWLRAVLKGHARVAAGLAIECPVLVMASDRSDFRRTWSDDLKRADIVLDVEQIAARAVKLGPHVTMVRIAGGMHDLVLSAPQVRQKVFDEMQAWAGAYVGQARAQTA